MRILIAADSFKEALSAAAVCKAIAGGVRRAMPDASIVCCPLADGGEGTIEVLTEALDLRTVHGEAADPFGQPMPASWRLSADGHTAFIEMAATAGLQLLPAAARNPLQVTSTGMGLQVQAALARGVSTLVLGIGGSAGNDGGIGLAHALGWRFLDETGVELAPIGGNLIHIRQINAPPQPFPARVQVICDVDNPLYGPQGAAFVYAPQKGADPDMVARLDAGLRRLAEVAEQQFGPRAPRPEQAGNGAAGGMGYGLRLFLQAELSTGADTVMDLLGFDTLLAQCDQVFTGEGRIDAQTAHGKLIQRVCSRANARGKPVTAFCGRLEADAAALAVIGLQAAYSINRHTPDLPLPVLLAETAARLEQCAYELCVEG